MNRQSGAAAIAGVLFCSTALAQSEGPLLGAEPDYLDLGAGAFNVLSTRDKPTVEANAEFRFGEKLWGIGPALGLLANGQGGVFGYAGLYSDIALGHWIITPLVGLGGYARGNSEQLGGIFEFRASGTLAYEFDDRSRFGVRFGHISNAGIHYTNPSDNEALLTYSMPIGL